MIELTETNAPWVIMAIEIGVISLPFLVGLLPAFIIRHYLHKDPLPGWHAHLIAWFLIAVNIAVFQTMVPDPSGMYLMLVVIGWGCYAVLTGRSRVSNRDAPEASPTQTN